MAQDASARGAAEEEAEEHVVIDFGNADEQPHMSQSYRLIGLDTAHPYLQLDDVLFRGTWARTVGTDLHYDARGQIVAKSTRRLIMRRVEIVKKDNPDAKRAPRDRIIRAPPVATSGDAAVGSPEAAPSPPNAEPDAAG